MLGPLTPLGHLVQSCATAAALTGLLSGAGGPAPPLGPHARRSLPERTEVTCMNGARGRIPFPGRESGHRARKGAQERPPLRAQAAGRREAARGGSRPSDAGRHPPAPGPRGAAFFQSQRSRPPRRGAGPLARPQSRLVSPERPGDVTRAGRAQPATFRARQPPARHRSAQQGSPARPRGGAATQQQGARPEARVRGRVRAPESRSSPRAAAPGTELSGPRTRTSAATRTWRAAQRARPRAYKQAQPRASTSARSRAAPTRSPTHSSPTRGAKAREPRDILRSGAAPRSPGPSGSGPPAPARPPAVVWGGPAASGPQPRLAPSPTGALTRRRRRRRRRRRSTRRPRRTARGSGSAVAAPRPTGFSPHSSLGAILHSTLPANGCRMPLSRYSERWIPRELRLPPGLT